jgi:hypothetical protein
MEQVADKGYWVYRHNENSKNMRGLVGLKKQVKLVRLGAKFQIAQVGTYSTSLPLLLEAHEIAGPGWNLKRQASVRLGSIRPASEVELRAKKAGAAVALRLFDANASSLSLAIRILTLESHEDAKLWTSTLEDKTSGEDSSFRQTPVTFVHGIELPEFGIQRGSTFVLSVKGTKVVKEVAGFVDNVAFVVRLLAEDDACSWSDVLEIAQLQGTKIKEKMAQP